MTSNVLKGPTPLKTGVQVARFQRGQSTVVGVATFLRRSRLEDSAHGTSGADLAHRSGGALLFRAARG